MKKSYYFFAILLVIGIFVAFSRFKIEKDFSNTPITQLLEKSKPNIKSTSKSNKLSFLVVSDIHGNTDKFRTAMKDIKNLSKDLDALVLNGDIVDQGLDKDYEEMKKYLYSNKNNLPSNLLINIGNHEFYYYDKGVNTEEESKDFLNRFLNFSGRDQVYFDKFINGYYFMFLGTERGYTEDLGSVKADLSVAQLNWLEENLKKNYKPNKPIFIFMHQPLTDGVYGGTRVRNTIVQDKELRDIFSKYPEIILFSSHTHMTLESGKAIVNQGFTLAETSSLSKPIGFDQNGKFRRLEYGEGMYVEVDENNKVQLKGLRLGTGQWIPEAIKTIEF